MVQKTHRVKRWYRVFDGGRKDGPAVIANTSAIQSVSLSKRPIDRIDDVSIK
jgi:hypothetical protein